MQLSRMGVEMDWCSVCVCCVCMCCGEEAPKAKGNRMRTVQDSTVVHEALHDDVAWDREPVMRKWHGQTNQKQEDKRETHTHKSSKKQE